MHAMRASPAHIVCVETSHHKIADVTAIHGRAQEELRDAEQRRNCLREAHDKKQYCSPKCPNCNAKLKHYRCGVGGGHI